jgi:hypothetical protein
MGWQWRCSTPGELLQELGGVGGDGFREKLRPVGHGPVGHGVPLWRGATAVPPRAANPGAACGSLATDRRPHMSANFKYQKTRKFPPSQEKLMEVGNPIWNTFQYCNFFQIFTDFELFQRF